MEQEKLNWIERKFYIFLSKGGYLNITKNSKDTWIVVCKSEIYTYEFIINFKPKLYLEELLDVYKQAYKDMNELECIKQVLEDTTEIFYHFLNVNK